jgi:hypothetical protein
MAGSGADRNAHNKGHMDLISLLVFLIVIGLIFWAVSVLATAFAFPAPIVTVIHVVLVIVVVLWMLEALGLYSGGPSLRLR